MAREMPITSLSEQRWLASPAGFEPLSPPEGTPMSYSYMRSRIIGFTVLYSVAVLAPIIPKTAVADRLPGETQLYEVASICQACDRPAAAWQSVGVASAVIDLCPPVILTGYQPPTGEGLVELQVPAALLQTLQTTPQGKPPGELQVPAALFILLQTDGQGKLP
jgi:hypothetical protein